MSSGPPRDVDPIADWEDITALFGLPAPRLPPTPVSGGWSHSVWRVETADGACAVKEMREGRGAWWIEQLTAAVEFELKAWRTGTIGMAEPLMLTGSKAILGRLDVGSEHRWYRCHRWVDGQPCLGDAPNPRRSGQVGMIMAELSRLNVQKGSTADQLAWNALEAYDETVAEACSRGFAWGVALADLGPNVERLRRDLEDLARRAVPMLMLHRDLDPKNTATRGDGALVLFDWDNAGPRLLESELLDAALSFAGEGAAVDDQCLTATLDAYSEAGGQPVTFADAAAPTAADGFGWMMLNAWRALGHRDLSPEQATFASAMVEQLASTWPAAIDTVQSWAAHAASR